MNLLSKRQKRRAIIATVVYFFMILISAQLIYIRGLTNLKPIYILNIGCDMFGMLMGYVLFICCLIDVQKTGSNLKWLLCLINVAYLGVFSDSVAWLVDGVVKYRWLNYVDNFLYYCCAPFEAFFFWMYTRTYLELDKKSVKALDILARVGLFLAIFFRIINQFNGMYYTITPESIYQRSALYPMSMIYSFVTIIGTLTVVVIERKNLQKYQIVAFFVYGLGPLVISIITSPAYGLSIIASVIMLVILVMYGVLNLIQGREKAVADRDLSLAKSIQENVLPRVFPPFPDREEFSLYGSMTPAKEVGGDFYDFYLIDDDHLAITMADVSGKGVPAALFMMIAKIIIKTQTLNSTDLDPNTILGNVNNQLCEGNILEMFVTVWHGILTISTGELVYSNAGHEYPALKRRAGKFELVKEKHSPPVATLEDIRFKGGKINLYEGDVIFLYTDGVTEATNIGKELFGEERLLTALNENLDKSVEDIDKNVRTSIDHFVKDAPQFDDITILALQYHGVAEGSSDS